MVACIDMVDYRQMSFQRYPMRCLPVLLNLVLVEPADLLLFQFTAEYKGKALALSAKVPGPES